MAHGVQPELERHAGPARNLTFSWLVLPLQSRSISCAWCVSVLSCSCHGSSFTESAEFTLRNPGKVPMRTLWANCIPASRVCVRVCVCVCMCVCVHAHLRDAFPHFRVRKKSGKSQVRPVFSSTRPDFFLTCSTASVA